jgi:predicted HicB family RNase H-like nuclease
MSDKFDGFGVTLIEDNGEWVAHFIELPNVSAVGDTPEDALRELETAWEAMKASYRKHGDPIPVAPIKKEYSGQFNVRIDKRIHRALAIEAAHAGITLNALVAQKLAQQTDFSLGQTRTR